MTLTQHPGTLGLAVLTLLAGCRSNRPDPDITSNEAIDQARDTTPDAPPDAPGCAALPDADQLRRLLTTAPDSGPVGGLFGGRAEWAAVVDRSGRICVVVPPGDSAGGHWPGSRTIAMAKAFTANGFSTDTLPFSTARLYTLTQPGHSLWGVGQPEPFDPECLSPGHEGAICGGAIAFGGGVPLYRNRGVVGGLGISGDTPCADHEIAKRIRGMAGLAPPAGNLADDIVYPSVDGPSIYAHPVCPNTWRNGRRIGDESPARGY